MALPVELWRYILERDEIIPIAKKVCCEWRKLLREARSVWFVAHLAKNQHVGLLDWCRLEDAYRSTELFQRQIAIGTIWSGERLPDIEMIKKLDRKSFRAVVINAIVAYHDKVISDHIVKKLIQEYEKKHDTDIEIYYYCIRYGFRDWEKRISNTLSAQIPATIEMIKYHPEWITNNGAPAALMIAAPHGLEILDSWIPPVQQDPEIGTELAACFAAWFGDLKCYDKLCVTTRLEPAIGDLFVILSDHRAEKPRSRFDNKEEQLEALKLQIPKVLALPLVSVFRQFLAIFLRNLNIVSTRLESMIIKIFNGVIPHDFAEIYPPEVKKTYNYPYRIFHSS